jgi:sugar lactone lactonase YvrE
LSLFALSWSHAPKRNLRIAAGIALILASLLIGIFTNVPHALAFSNGQTESIVIGQSNLSSSVSGAGPSGLLSPEGIAFDSSGNLWVADAGNGRVLEFKAPLSTDEKASIVLGEPNFNTTTECFAESVIPASCLSTPTGLAFDSSGNLWVSDSTDSRVVEFKTPFATGENASMVLGQPNLTTGENPDQVPTASNFNPGEALGGMTFDSAGNIWVTDTGFNRVLEFKAPFSMGESASTVLGWSNFTAGAFEQSPPTASSLAGPMDVHFDSSGNLWVADEHNNRIVEFKPPFSNGEAPSAAIGQPDTSTFNGLCIVEPGTFCLSTPQFFTFDKSGGMWVSDTTDFRAVHFNAPLSSGENASTVLGLDNFTASGPIDGIANATATDLSAPEGIALDPSGNVWVSDGGSNRVVEFAVTSSATSATTSTSSSTSTTSTPVPEFPASALVITCIVSVAFVALISRRFRLRPEITG